MMIDGIRVRPMAILAQGRLDISVGRVGIGSERVGSCRLRVELWLGWVGPLSDQGVVSRFGVETGWVDPT